uniref:rhomboid protease n=1 Tax=Anolis carolinensis TaxID=28377 RepID=A0A803T7P6_ANOCA
MLTEALERRLKKKPHQAGLSLSLSERRGLQGCRGLRLSCRPSRPRQASLQPPSPDRGRPCSPDSAAAPHRLATVIAAMFRSAARGCRRCSWERRAGKERKSPPGPAPPLAAWGRFGLAGGAPEAPGDPLGSTSHKNNNTNNIEHILGNLVLQLVLGIPLELVHKGHRVGLVYLAGVLGGSLASSVCDPLLGLVGASGGVYALIGGYFMNVLVNFREMIPLFGVARLLFIFIIGFLRGPHCGRTGRDVSGIRHIQLLRQKFRQGPPVLGLHWCLCALRGVCCVLQCIPLSSKPVERWDGCPRALKDKNIQKYICMLRSAYLGTARPLALPSHYGTVCLLYLILKKQSFSIAVLVLCSGGLGVAAEGQAI